VLAAALIRATNPHVKWVGTDGHGFGVLEVTTSPAPAGSDAR
jgi:alkaline phosphatase D